MRLDVTRGVRCESPGAVDGTGVEPTELRGGDDVAVGAAEEDCAGDAVGGHREQNTGVAPVFNADFHRLRMDRISFAQWSRPQVKAVFARWQYGGSQVQCT